MAISEKTKPPPSDDAGDGSKSDRLGKAIDHESKPRAAPVQVALRDYQVEGVGAIRAAYAAGRRRVCYVLPTGGGKTVLFSYVVGGAAARGRRVLILAHRIEIVNQISRALSVQSVNHGVIAPSAPEEGSASVQIAMVPTLAHRLDAWRDRFDLIVLDEAHHSVAGSWATVIAAQPGAKILGVTATPERLDGRGLREIFDELIVGPSVAELIAAGHLSPFTLFAPADTPDLSGVATRGGDYALEQLRESMSGVVIRSAVAGYLQHCHGAPAIVFAVDLQHSRDVVAAFRDAGISAVHVDGDTPEGVRRAALEALARGDLRVISNVSLFGEGVDIPNIGSAILLRPTQSGALYLQQCGRALRLAPGKDRALILDFAGNAMRHGLPDAPRDWSLDAKPRRLRKIAEGPRLRHCKGCGAVNPPISNSCLNCGADLITKAERREINVRLRETHDAALAARIRSLPYPARLRWARSDEGRLRAVARACGYEDGWVWHALREQRGAA